MILHLTHLTLITIVLLIKTFILIKEWTLPDHPGGKSLFLLDYDLWKPSRQLMVPTFSLANIKRIRNLFEDSIQLFMNNMEKFAISGEPFDIRPYFESFVLDTILRAFFATEVDSAKESNNPLVINSRKIFMKDISFEQFIALFCSKNCEIV